MSESMYIAASGALTQQLRLEVLANNLANTNTIGFKEDRTSFKAHFPDVAAATEEDQGEPVAEEAPTVLDPYLSNNFYVTFEGSTINFTPGEFKHTGNALDFALNGSGFFCVETTDGTHYTRKGNFSLNQDGVLVTSEGLTVLGEGGEIRIDGRDVMVDGKGNVLVDGTVVGTLKIVDFPQPYQLEKIGESLFSLSDLDVPEEKAEGTEIMQGLNELSNVDSVRTMTEMIEVLRTYESYQKIIQSVSEVTSKAINEVGRLA